MQFEIVSRNKHYIIDNNQVSNKDIPAVKERVIKSAEKFFGVKYYKEPNKWYQELNPFILISPEYNFLTGASQDYVEKLQQKSTYVVISYSRMMELIEQPYTGSSKYIAEDVLEFNKDLV